MLDDDISIDNGKIICLECKKEFIMITAAHLKKFHSMTVEGYKLKYPEAELTGEIFKAKQRHKKKIILNKESNNLENNSNIKEIDNIREMAQKRINQDNQYIGFREEDFDEDSFKNLELEENENVENIKEKDEKDEEFITANKEIIINFLIKNGFENLKNNYFIRKLSLIGIMEYEFISDMSDPIKKVDFEFPNAFWHNHDKYLNFRRDKILKDDGWKIIKIETNTISSNQLLNEIEQNLNNI